MWIKPLSLFTFAIFLSLLGLRMFSNQSEEFNQVGVTEESQKNESIFDMEPEKARKLLDELDTYVKRDEQRKKGKTFKRTTLRKRKFPIRKVSQQKKLSNPEKHKAFISKKYEKLDEAIQSRSDNLLEIRFLQDEIKRYKVDNEIELSNIETWSIEFIFYLVIKEQLTFEEILAIKSEADLGFTPEEWISMKANAETDVFKNQILTYKGIEVVDDEIEQEFVDTEYDDAIYPDSQTDRGRNEEVLSTIQDGEFSRSEYNDEPNREPSQYEDDSNSEYDYEY